MRIGFVGAGLMGAGMVRQLVGAGHTVRLYARTASKAAGLPAELVSTITAAVEGMDLACSCVTDSADVVQVVEAILRADNPPPVLVELSTIAPSVARELAARCEARGVNYLDCPVSGGPEGAASGTLAIMCGGDARSLAVAAPALDVMGDPAKRVHFGPVGSGLVAKLVNNMLVASITAATVEALGVGQREGLDPAVLREAVLAATGASWQLQYRIPNALAGNFAAGFTTDNLRKDLGHAAALTPGPTPFLELSRHLYDDVDGSLDFVALARYFMDLPASTERDST